MSLVSVSLQSDGFDKFKFVGFFPLHMVNFLKFSDFKKQKKTKTFLGSVLFYEGVDGTNMLPDTGLCII